MQCHPECTLPHNMPLGFTLLRRYFRYLSRYSSSKTINKRCVWWYFFKLTCNSLLYFLHSIFSTFALLTHQLLVIMTRSAALISTIVLALSLSSSASPLVTIDKPSQGINLPFAVQLNVANVTIPEIDLARVSHLFARGKAKVAANDTTSSVDRRASSFSIANTAIAYTTVINVGSPATSYTLLIDRGSSNTWVGARSAYKRTKTSISAGHSVQASYGSGSFSGSECKYLHKLAGCSY